MNDSGAQGCVFPMLNSGTFKDIIDSIPTGVCVFGRVGDKINCIAANSNYASMIGMDESCLIGMSTDYFLSHIHPEDRDRCRTEIIDDIGKKEKVCGTYRIFNKAENKYNWVRLDGKKFLDSPDYGHSACFTYTNVNDQINTEQALVQNQQALNSMIQLVPGGIFVYSADEDEHFSFVSENMLSMLGYSRDEFDIKFGGRFSQMVYEDDRQRVIEEINEQIDVGSFDTCSYRIEKKNGELLWVHDEGHIVTDTHGKKWFYVVIVDITTSVLAKEYLATKNKELRQIIDSIPVSIVVYKKLHGEVSIAAVNGYLCSLSGVTAEYLMGLSQKELIDFIYMGDRESATSFFHNLFENDNASAELTYRTLIAPARGYQWYHCSAIQLPQEDGSAFIYAVYTDATYQKVKEMDYNRIIQDLLTSNPNSLCTFRLNLSMNQCSDGHGVSSYTRQLLEARTADGLLEKIASVITSESDAEMFRKKCGRLRLIESYKSGRDRVSVVYRRKTAEGDSHWVTTYFHLLQNPYTNDIEAIAYSYDSDSERKKEEIISAITSKEYDYIGLIDMENMDIGIYYISAAVAESLGETLKKYDAIIDFVSTQIPESKRSRYLGDVSMSRVVSELETGSEYVCSYTSENAAGEKQRKLLTFRYLDELKREIMFTRADITSSFLREEAYAEQLRQALLNAEKANEMKTDFLGNVSHDIRTPLNAILGYDRLALDSDDPAEIKDYLRKMYTAGGTLLSLINDTLDLQKIENGQTELRLKPTRCSDVIKDTVNSVLPIMKDKNIRFSVDNSRAAMATINADSLRLREIFINLLSNAAKFTPNGGHVEFVIECIGLEPNIVHDKLTVRDSGIGMSREFQEKMFEPFAQEHTKDTADISGSGLGLSIVRRLVDLMGGHIEVRSEPGRGTEFTVYLDFERLDDMPSGNSREDIPNDIRGLNILLCEDNAMNTEIARRILNMNGASVTSVTDGAKGVAAFTASSPDEYDIILMDLRMPNMDGYTAAKKIRKSQHPRAKTIPILAMSADAYDSDVEASLKSGMNGHIAKPIDPNRMITEIRRMTGKERELPGGRT